MPGIKGTVAGAKGEAQAPSKKRAAAVADVSAEDGGQKQRKKVKASADAAMATGAGKGSPSTHAPGAANSNTEDAQLSPDAYRKEHDITVKAYGAGSPEVWQRFTDAPLPEKLQTALKAAGFKAPSPIQAQAWPLAMTGRDVLATAKTGSGKTCGYLIPAITKYLEKGPHAAPRPNATGTPSIVVMSPTRELAVQINQQASTFARAAGLKSVAVYGGAPKGPQIREVRSGAQIIVATPGRLKDLLAFSCSDGQAVLNLDSVQVLVLDEADRMCDMGFEDDIKKLVAAMPSTRQTLFFTATWPKAVARVASSILRNPIQVSIGSSDELRANKDIKQVVQVVNDNRDKPELLMKLVKEDTELRTIIFCNKKHLCDNLENDLWEAGFKVAAIHGDRSQEEREWAIKELRDGKMSLLVATDVAARGLDIKDLDRVINYDFPNNTEDYIHRIGRTGRAGARGTAHTFFANDDAKHASELVKILREAKQEVPAELEALGRNGGSGGGRGWGRGGSRQGGGNRWRGGGGGGGGRGRRW